MNIAVEADRANFKVKTGVEYYAENVVLEWSKLNSPNTFTILLRSKPLDPFLNLAKNFVIKVMPFPIFWTQLRISFDCLVNKYDRLFIPASALPIFHPKKSIVTIHDLAWIKYPETFTWFNRNFLYFSTWHALKFASKIIAVSEATKQDIVKYYKTDPKKISVVYHGFSYKDRAEDFVDEKIKAITKDPYVLFISTLQPRKNLEGLITALNKARQTEGIKHKLVVVGKTGWKFEKILKTIDANKDFVVYLNHVSDSEKDYLLKFTSALVLPSFYEGFGMTILEGFRAGVPVLCSNISSMPEVAGAAAEYFDPTNSQSMVMALKNVLTNTDRSQELVQLGTEKLSHFSWEKCARETLEVIENA